MSPVLIVVDDDRIYHFLVSRLLESVNFPVPDVNVLKFFSGKEVLEYFSEELDSSRKCVLLLDLNMPGLSGFDVLEALSEKPELHEHVSVYIVTSSVNSDDREKAEGYKMVKEFLIKPLKKEGLQEVVDLELDSAK